MQIFSLCMEKPYGLIASTVRKYNNKKSGNHEITKWFPIMDKEINKIADNVATTNSKNEDDGLDDKKYDNFDDVFEEDENDDGIIEDFNDDIGIDYSDAITL